MFLKYFHMQYQKAGGRLQEKHPVPSNFLVPEVNYGLKMGIVDVNECKKKMSVWKYIVG